jgi:hypothetical protein
VNRCIECGSKFVGRKRPGYRQQFCSRRCSQYSPHSLSKLRKARDVRWAETRKRHAEFRCQHCGSHKRPGGHVAERGEPKFCSTACAIEAKRIYTDCLQCGSRMNKPRQIFCSRRCRGLFDRVPLIRKTNTHLQAARRYVKRFPTRRRESLQKYHSSIAATASQLKYRLKFDPPPTFVAAVHSLRIVKRLIKGNSHERQSQG